MFTSREQIFLSSLYFLCLVPYLLFNMRNTIFQIYIFAELNLQSLINQTAESNMAWFYWLFFIVILPDMEAGSCELRRLFTSLYSLPSFLALLGAASLELSLQQKWVHHIYCFDFDYMQIFLYESMVVTSAVGLKKFGENNSININYQAFNPIISKH